MPPDEPNEEERLQQLPQDGQTPFQPADPNPGASGNTTDPVVGASDSQDLPVDHPGTDSNLQPEELYDEGVSGAAEVSDDSGQTAVTSYDPEADKRQTD